MGENIFLGLLYNISLLLMMALILTIFQDKIKSAGLINNLALGFSIGIVGLLVMSTAVQFDSGTFFDTRTVLISTAGLFFGFIPTLIGAGMMISYRIYFGGVGMYMGVMTIFTTAAIGTLWHQYRFPKILEKKKTNLLEFYLFGLIVHIDMLLCSVAFPQNQILNMLSIIVLPVLLLYPLGTYLLCRLLLNQYVRNELIIQFKEKEQELTVVKERYDQLSVQSRVFVWECDEKGLITYVDFICEIVTGYRAVEVIQKKYFYDFLLPEEREIVRENARDVFKFNMQIKDAEYRILTKDRRILWVLINGIPMLSDDGTLLGYRGSNTDITERKQVELERAKEAGLIISLLDSIPELVFYKDLNGVYLGCNLPFTIFVGKTKDEIVGKTDYDIFNKDTADFFRYHDQEMLKEKIPRHNEERLVYPDGKKIFIDMLKTPYWDAKGNLIGLLGISRDITENKRKEEEIIYISYHDQLTGLYNRRFYEEELSRLNVKRNLPLTIVIADINGLKLINDSFGYSVGDELIKTVAETIQKGFRSDDIIARYGGDEFVIILSKTDTLEAEKVISRVKESFHDKKVYGINISVSFGFETKVYEYEDLQEITKKSEDNMYRHKLYESSSMRSKTIDLIMNTLYEKNHREMMHSKRVGEICGKIAEAMGMDENRVSQIKIAGLVHDIGKIGIDERILNSPGKLNEEEWKEMQKHSEIGYRILRAVNEFSEIANYVLEHQEKWDGTGYPRGIKGEEISLQARIIAIADAYDAMTSYRTYGKEKTKEEAIEEIRRCSGIQFDPKIAEIFIKIA